VNDDTFLLYVRESLMDIIHGGGGSQMVIYAIDVKSLAICWQAEPIFALYCTVNFVPALGVVVAVGRNAPHNMTWIAVLDKDAGACLRMEFIDQHSEVGGPHFGVYRESERKESSSGGRVRGRRLHRE
jgi:hypothetical protein